MEEIPIGKKQKEGGGDGGVVTVYLLFDDYFVRFNYPLLTKEITQDSPDMRRGLASAPSFIEHGGPTILADLLIFSSSLSLPKPSWTWKMKKVKKRMVRIRNRR